MNASVLHCSDPGGPADGPAPGSRQCRDSSRRTGAHRQDRTAPGAADACVEATSVHARSIWIVLTLTCGLTRSDATGHPNGLLGGSPSQTLETVLPDESGIFGLRGRCHWLTRSGRRSKHEGDSLDSSTTTEPGLATGGDVILLETAALDVSAAILWAVAGILLGGVFSFLTVRFQLGHERREADRRHLVNLRTNTFHDLWKITQDVPRNPTVAEMTGFNAAALVNRMHQWYFQVGGLYLTETTREAYFSLLGALENHTEIGVTEEQYAPLYQKGSALRKALVLELQANASTAIKQI